jgi:parvulin-like peptidyl-prolyl isomerase
MPKRYAVAVAFISLVCFTELAQAIQGRLFVTANVVDLCQVPSLTIVRSAQRSYACAATALNQTNATPSSQPVVNILVDDLSNTVTYSF